MQLVPTTRVMDQLSDRDLTWQEVEADLARPRLVLPVLTSDTRKRLEGERFVGFVEPDVYGRDLRHLVHVSLRGTVEPVPLEERVVGIETKQTKYGKRGGSGTAWPTTWDELLRRLNGIDGVRVRLGGKHYLVVRNEAVVDTIPKSSSDYRALRNACFQLRRKGLDVSRRAT